MNLCLKLALPAPSPFVDCYHLSSIIHHTIPEPCLCSITVSFRPITSIDETGNFIFLVFYDDCFNFFSCQLFNLIATVIGHVFGSSKSVNLADED